MEPILVYLKRKLKEAGSNRWELIAAESGVSKHLPRKIAYDSKRENPGIKKIQPLLDYFHQVESGERELPVPDKSEAA